MNIMIGMINPERNWALKLALYSSSFSVSKRGLDLALPPEDLDQGVAGEGLLDVGVESPGPPPLGDELPLRPLHHQAGEEHRDRDGDQRHQCQRRGDVEHHPHYEDHRQQRCEQLAHRLLERLGHVVDVVGHPAEQLAAVGGRSS